MNETEFLVFAKSIYNSDDEAARRSAVSRAYYALFHNVRQNFINMGISVSKRPEEHQRMADCLLQSGIVEAMTAGQSMCDLRTARNEADYNLSLASYNKMISALHCAKAEAAINELARVNKSALHAALRSIGNCR